jgi:hypothetical protein
MLVRLRNVEAGQEDKDKSGGLFLDRNRLHSPNDAEGVEARLAADPRRRAILRSKTVVVILRSLPVCALHTQPRCLLARGTILPQYPLYRCQTPALLKRGQLLSRISDLLDQRHSRTTVGKHPGASSAANPRVASGPQPTGATQAKLESGKRSERSSQQACQRRPTIQQRVQAHDHIDHHRQHRRQSRSD